MAAEIDHIELANKNHDALLYLLSAPGMHTEWVATIAFYKAVQIVEAVFAHHLHKHTHGHDGRIDALKCPLFADLYTAFRPLFSASLVARYLEDGSARRFDGPAAKTRRYTGFSSYMTPAAVKTQLLRKRLNVLEQCSAKFLSDEARQKLKRIQGFLEQDASRPAD